MAKFDLHLHSSYSDGSDNLKELVQNIITNDVKIFSLTDHDTIEGCVEMQNLIPDDTMFICGTELTCKTANMKSHILGYYCNPKNQELNSLIERGKILRRQKLETRIKYLSDKWNIILTEEEKNWLYSRRSVVKTHLANILVRRGLADNNVNAMETYLNGCKTENTDFDGEEAIETIVRSGGIPVWAHPLGGEGEAHISAEDFETKLKTMIHCGIKGIECYYSRYSIEETEFLKQYAIKNNLYISGGSDYHGSNKTVPICQLNIENKSIDSSEINLCNAY